MRQPVKTFVLWAVLVLLFFGLYQVFSRRPTTTISEGATQWLVLGIFVVIVVGFVGWARFQNSRPWRKKAQQGLEAFARGRYAQALEAWQQSSDLRGDDFSVRFNMGSARLCLWQVRQARSDFEAAQKLLGKAPNAQRSRALLDSQLAFTAALEGNLAEAAASRARLGPTGVDPLRPLTDAVIELREGRWADGQRQLRTSEAAQISGAMGHLVRALDAWCAFQLAGEVRHVDKVGLFGEAAPDGLKAAWPELVAFLETAPQA